MAVAESTFSAWLLTKLNAMKVDENVLLNYILSIVEGDEPRDEKLEILQSVLIDTGSSVSKLSPGHELTFIPHCLYNASECFRRMK